MLPRQVRHQDGAVELGWITDRTGTKQQGHLSHTFLLLIAKLILIFTMDAVKDSGTDHPTVCDPLGSCSTTPGAVSHHYF